MAKRVLVISSSFREHSNSEALADAFIDGVREAGNEAEKLKLKGRKLNFCLGCLKCQETKSGHCVQKDDAEAICQKMKDADVICFATPIYYYNVSGQLKVVLDRANPLFPVDYKFRDIYVLSTAAENEEDTPRRAVDAVDGWVECFPKARIAGSVFCGGVDAPDEIAGNAKLEEARKLGAGV